MNKILIQRRGAFSLHAQFTDDGACVYTVSSTNGVRGSYVHRKSALAYFDKLARRTKDAVSISVSEAQDATLLASANDLVLDAFPAIRFVWDAHT